MDSALCTPVASEDGCARPEVRTSLQPACAPRVATGVLFSRVPVHRKAVSRPFTGGRCVHVPRGRRPQDPDARECMRESQHGEEGLEQQVESDERAAQTATAITSLQEACACERPVKRLCGSLSLARLSSTGRRARGRRAGEGVNIRKSNSERWIYINDPRAHTITQDHTGPRYIYKNTSQNQRCQCLSRPPPP